MDFFSSTSHILRVTNYSRYLTKNENLVVQCTKYVGCAQSNIFYLRDAPLDKGQEVRLRDGNKEWQPCCIKFQILVVLEQSSDDQSSDQHEQFSTKGLFNFCNQLGRGFIRQVQKASISDIRSIGAPLKVLVQFVVVLIYKFENIQEKNTTKTCTVS